MAKLPMTAPDGWEIDPFADVRLGLSIFQMEPHDWLVRKRPVDREYQPAPQPIEEKQDDNLR